jgi:serine/threonine protein kinase
MMRSSARLSDRSTDRRSRRSESVPIVEMVPPPYELVRVLGRGGFGEVCLVRCPQTGEELAIKRLARHDPPSIASFKNEFRLIRHLEHPSLAELYELIATDHGWYLVMEYVRGETFTARIRDRVGVACAGPTLDDAEPVVAFQTETGGFDELQLRCALLKLARGVCALHDADVIHRDLKPSNVLVCPDGRVVILDFGLAAMLSDDHHVDLKTKLMGTPGYIAPEQARGLPVTRAVDWYAVGVMLFEALTGRLPYVGSVRDIMDAQLAGRVPDPAHFARVPDDLRMLCMDLLAADPAARPDGPEVLAALGVRDRQRSRSTQPAFVGRTAELATIAAALDDTVRDARPAVVHVVGGAGLGKSALITRALAEAAARGAIVLGARCHEREDLPYKAIDPLIDALTAHLLALSDDEVRAVMPDDVSALCQLFPALRQLRQEAFDPIDNLEELRRRAIAALRTLLARIGRQGPVVLAIDDLQWGCKDSADMLAEVLAGDTAPRVLVLLSYRTQESTPDLDLALLHDWLDATGVVQHVLALGTLTPTVSSWVS